MPVTAIDGRDTASRAKERVPQEHGLTTFLESAVCYLDGADRIRYGRGPRARQAVGHWMVDRDDRTSIARAAHHAVERDASRAQSEIDIVTCSAESPHIEMPDRRRHFFACDHEQPSSPVMRALVRGVVVVRDREEVEALVAGLLDELLRREFAVAVHRVSVQHADVPLCAVSHWSPARQNDRLRMCGGLVAAVHRHFDVDAVRCDLVEP